MDYESFMNEYNKQHACCPICHSENFSSTMMAYPYYEEHPEEVNRILQEGTAKAKAKAEETIKNVKKAMKIDY